MKDKKFTPEEITESLRVCAGAGCKGCVHPGCGEELCMNALNKIAADMLEELAAEAARLREESRWIPVEEQMPKEEGRYHCIVKSFAFPGQSYQALLFCDSNGFREGNIYTDDVTHWKPMPKGPEAE